MTSDARTNVSAGERAQPLTFLAKLGLPFCKLAVEQMGGVLWVDSSQGQGATFYFTLPRSETKGVEA